MRIKFKRDYRGKLTSEQFFEAGDVGEFDQDVGNAIIERGAGEATDAEPFRKVDRQSKNPEVASEQLEKAVEEKAEEAKAEAAKSTKKKTSKKK